MSKNDSKKYPACEICRQHPATSFSWFRDQDETGRRGEWKFACACTSDTELYYVEFESFFQSEKAQVEWLWHLQEKNWFDSRDWAAMMIRFQQATRAISAA